MSIGLDSTGYGCFLCGHPVIHDSSSAWFQTGSELGPKARCHISCLNGRTSVDIAAAYHRFIGDLVDMPRAHLGAVGRA